jgi:hypothetical protein
LPLSIVLVFAADLTAGHNAPFVSDVASWLHRLGSGAAEGIDHSGLEGENIDRSEFDRRMFNPDIPPKLVRASVAEEPFVDFDSVLLTCDLAGMEIEARQTRFVWMLAVRGVGGESHEVESRILRFLRATPENLARSLEKWQVANLGEPEGGVIQAGAGFIVRKKPGGPPTSWESNLR